MAWLDQETVWEWIVWVKDESMVSGEVSAATNFTNGRGVRSDLCQTDDPGVEGGSENAGVGEFYTRCNRLVVMKQRKLCTSTCSTR